MGTLSWNCHGLGLATAISELKHLVSKHNPQLLFVCDTKLVSPRVQWLRVSLGFSHVLVVDVVGGFGGLAWFWPDDVHVQIIICSFYAISLGFMGISLLRGVTTLE